MGRSHLKLCFAPIELWNYTSDIRVRGLAGSVECAPAVAENVSARRAGVVEFGGACMRWLTFLQNHREVIAAFDFFTVPTVTFQLLYCFFVIAHARRKILHFNITPHPNADCVVQQLREAFPEASPYRYVILDRDSKFDADVMTFLEATGLKAKQTSIQAPWQNGVAERWVGSCRREILDHVIVLNEEHLRRLIGNYVSYYHDDRIHDSLEKDTPYRRPVEPKPSANATVISFPRLGGLHHRYGWRDAA